MWSLLTRLCSVSKKEVVPTATTTTKKKQFLYSFTLPEDFIVSNFVRFQCYLCFCHEFLHFYRMERPK